MFKNTVSRSGLVVTARTYPGSGAGEAIFVGDDQASGAHEGQQLLQGVQVAALVRVYEQQVDRVLELGDLGVRIAKHQGG